MKIPALLIAGFLMILPFLLPEYTLHIAVMILFWSYLSLSWNILGGIGGQFSLGHPVFLAAGAYTSTLLFLELGLSPWLGMLAGVAVAGVLAAIMGIVTFRYELKGIGFGLVTLALAGVASALVSGTEALGASRGLFIVPAGTSLAAFQFQSKIPYYYIILIFVLLALGITYWVQSSRMGHYLRAVSQNEIGARALGVDSVRVKTAATVLSAAMTAVAGTFYAQYILFIDPQSLLGITISVQIILFVAIGGRGTLLGPIVGPLLLMPLGEFLRVQFGSNLPGLHQLVYGVVLILVIRFLPKGIIHTVHDVYGMIVTRFASKRGSPVNQDEGEQLVGQKGVKI